jgi:copper homeostasis protein CutC
MTDALDLSRLVQQFVEGANTSTDAANRIELALDVGFPDDQHVQQTVEMLAMYRPGGGEFLFDTTEIQKRLAETMLYLEQTPK